MKLLHEKVTHKTYGAGEVVDQSEKYISVLFSTGDKVQFVYPKSIGTFLTLTNIKKQAEIVAQVQSTTEATRMEQEKHRNEVLSRINRVKNVTMSKSGHLAGLGGGNIAFKCNYCDGGCSKDSIGYQGVCSDAIIRNNIKIEHKIWCSNENSACNAYLNHQISRQELENRCAGAGGKIICYESQMLKEWRAFAGLIQTGKNKGKPMKLKDIGTDSLCVLTTRLPESKEATRMIFAVFLVDQSYEDDVEDDGIVKSQSRYRIALTPLEAKQMPFWKYHVNANQPQKPAWSSGLHRFFGNEEAAQILKDIAILKKGTSEDTHAREFLEYYCKVKHLNQEFLSEPNGALLRNDL